MTETKLHSAREWLLAEWSERVSSVLESLADKRPVIEPTVGEAAPLPPDAAVWRQFFAIVNKPGVWIAFNPSTFLDLGRRTLIAAGLENPTDSECRSASSEIISQSMAALGKSMSANWECESAATQGDDAFVPPASLNWSSVTLAFPGAQPNLVWFAAEPEFLLRLVSGASKPTEAQAESGSFTADVPYSTSYANGSKTLDLLLEVALPVSISFGRTLLPIREVLKLSTGSIVELDRTIDEPVEVIVNNCVIARGEVVVVEGYYGVRIQQIASRYDRLRTGAAVPSESSPVISSKV